MDERYVVITVLTDKSTVDRACAVLEAAGIPILIELLKIAPVRNTAVKHSGMQDDGAMNASIGLSSGYRIMAPFHHSQNAMRLLGLASGHSTQEAA